MKKFSILFFLCFSLIHQSYNMDRLITNHTQALLYDPIGTTIATSFIALNMYVKDCDDKITKMACRHNIKIPQNYFGQAAVQFLLTSITNHTFRQDERYIMRLVGQGLTACHVLSMRQRNDRVVSQLASRN